MNNKQLRTQFSRLALLRACAVLYRNQDKLRSVLLQPTPSLDVALGVTASELGGALGMPSAAARAIHSFFCRFSSKASKDDDGGFKPSVLRKVQKCLVDISITLKEVYSTRQRRR